MIALSNGPARLTIARRGAEPLAWTIGDTPLLWPGDPAVWPRTAPILFPIVGWARGGQIRHRGVGYPMGVHGFAAALPFEVVDSDSASARLRLTPDPGTRARYPFDFRLDAIYALEPEAVVWTLEATNCGAEPMPYAAGLHPGFCWPLAGSARAHSFLFDVPERPDVPVIAPGGLFSTERRTVPFADVEAPRPQPGALWGGGPRGEPARGRRLALTSDLMAQEALCFLDISSRGATLDNGAGASLRVDLDGFPHLALWARPPAPFLCIEAWTGYGDPVDFAGELSDKPSMRLLAPRETGRHSARFSFKSDATVTAALGAGAGL